VLLSEILDKSSPYIKTSNKRVNDLLSQKKHQVVGVGAQSLAYLHKKFPGKVIKTIQVYGDSDPSYQFLRLALKHQDNPYFPKIFSVKMYPTERVFGNERARSFEEIDPTEEFSPAPYQAEYTLYVVMERLQPLIGMTEQDLERFGIEDFPIPQRMKTWRRQAEIKFRQAFNDPKWRLHMQQFVRDPALKQALRLLEPLFKHFAPDMHSGNILTRGNSWVFVDPITHSTYGSD
jgi:hypothetical protein